MYEAISVEERNKPAVALIYENFAHDARSAASNKGLPGVRLIPEPVPSEWTDLNDIEGWIDTVMNSVVDALTTPLTADEKSPKPRVVEKLSRIVFKGNLEEVNRFFFRRGWTDGLPIIPPTEEAVAEMLTGTDLPPEQIIAKLEPRLGKATVEKIAVNAVMAGALPTHLPLLIAGVRCLGDPLVGPTGMAVSTGSFAPLWLVNGPIRNDIHVNHGYGALGPGDIANAAIGRAMALITKNVRGVRKGVEDMGVLGNPAKYTMALAENDEDSPWEPFHVEHGFKKDDSAISIFFAQTFEQLFPYGTDDKGLLSTIVYNIPPVHGGTQMLVMLTPALAKVLANKGWNKKTIIDYIVENARVPASHHPAHYDKDANTGDFVPLFTPNSADRIHIIVAGGPGSRVGQFSGSPRPMVTHKAELPANWEKLVAKYKNVVPVYAAY